MKTTLLLILAGILSGCVNTGRKFDDSQLFKIKRGESSRSDVELALGPPCAVTETDGPAGRKTMLTYSYAAARLRCETFVPVAGPFIGGANGYSRTAQIVIGSDGKVESLSYCAVTNRVNTGSTNHSSEQ